MQVAKKGQMWMIIGVAILVIIAVIFWLKPSTSATKSTESFTQNSENLGTVATPKITDQQALSYASHSQQDTQVNCQIRLDNSNHLIVNEQTKDCFEYFLTQYGEKTIDQIKNDFIKYIQVSYQDPAKSQIDDLWKRYVDYRGQLGTIEAPKDHQNDSSYYRTIFNNINNLRKKFFSEYEIQGLFGPEDIYNNYTLDRMKILDDKSLSAQEKAKKLKALFDQLPADLRENLQQVNQLEDLRKLTSDIKARGGSAQEIHDMRVNLVGAEATGRLETLDIQRDNWKQQVNQYLAARDSIMQSPMSDSAKQDAVNQLRQQQFSSTSDQTRVQTFETVHDQGGKLPFAQ